MWKLYLVISATYCALCVATVSAAALTASFTRYQRKRYPWLCWLDGRQVELASVTAVALIIGYSCYAIKDILTLRLSVELAPVSGTTQPEKASALAIQAEMRKMFHERAGAAVDAFADGDRALRAFDWGQAITAYRRSIALAPSKSAYLNLAIASSNVANFTAAADAAKHALALPRSPATALVDANCLLQLGLIELEIKNLDAARTDLTEAVMLFRKWGDRDGEAVGFENLGLVANFMGLRAEAIDRLEQAEELYALEDNRLGRASIVYDRAVVMRDAGQRDFANAAFRQALKLYLTVDNAFGAAEALYQMGTLAFEDGRREDARKFLNEALTLAPRAGLDSEQSAMIRRKLTALGKD